ncbi:MAG TPA: TonB-dependent receptor [Bryobacteraceae bacterium]|nr:TonB-dependent receptor [Bryobacteraceae bacterium]
MTDSSGAVVPGAKVTATNLGTGLTYISNATADGNYLITQLPSGHYRITAEKEGFKTWTTPDVNIAIGDRYRANARLEVGQITQTVEVQADAAPLQTDSAQVASLVDERQVQDLPLNGRNFVQLTQLVPGATDYTAGSFSTGNAVDDRRRPSAVSVNGFNGAQNNFMIDGMDNNERFIATVTVKPSIEAIGEIKVITNTFSAELSRANGAGISFITKGGTNNFHGSLFEFFRNQALDARQPILLPTQPKAPYRQNNFGASAGGPIKKNRTFFFADWESYLVGQGQVNQLTVPLASEIAGDFNTIGLGANAAIVTPIYDPLTTTVVPTSVSSSGATRTQFANNQIPQSRFDPAAVKILALYPAPELPGTTLNYVSAPSRTQNDGTMDERIDHRFSDKSNFYGRYSYNHTTTTTPHNLPTAPSGIDPVGNGGGYTDQANQAFQVNEVYTLNPSTILVLQASYTRWALSSLQTNFGKNVAAQLGIPGVNIDSDSSGIPGITLGTANGIQSLTEGGYQPNLDYNNTFQENGSFQFTRGAHSMKTGLNVIRRQVNETQSADPRGTFTFNAIPTSDTINTTNNQSGNGLASLLLGMYTTASRSKYLVHPGYRFMEYGAYFQDDWRVNRWLTLNLGMRWDYYSPLSEEYGRIPNFDFSTLGLVFPGVNGVSNTAGVRKDKRDFAPRFGFAAQLNPKTVIRGGFGINYAPDLQGTPGAFRNPPYNYSLPTRYTTQPNPYTPVGYLLSQGLPPITESDPNNIVGGIAGVSMNYQTPRTYQYNLFIQRELPLDLVLNIGYVGNLGRELSGSNVSYQWDGAAPGSGNIIGRRVYAAALPNVTSIGLVTNYFNSSYNSLQTTLTHRFQHGMNLVVNHTWAKALDDGTLRYIAFATPSLLKGNSGSDIRQRVSIAMNYNLPFGGTSHSFVAKVVHQWKLNVIGTVQTGSPLAISSGANVNGATGPNYPNVVGDANGPGTYNEWFNTAAFVNQPNFTWGNAGRVIGFGPGRWDFDTGLQREFKPMERMTLQFRLESFNVTNTQSPANPNTSVGNTNFGRITSISGSRQQQVGLKILF